MNVSIMMVTALTLERHRTVINLMGSSRILSTMRTFSDIKLTSKSRPFLSALVLSVVVIYPGSIVVKEFVDGHISTSRSWFASVVIGGLALVAAWRAVCSWRKVGRTSGVDDKIE
jgi:hypothetical protein